MKIIFEEMTNCWSLNNKRYGHWFIKTCQTIDYIKEVIILKNVLE